MIRGLYLSTQGAHAQLMRLDVSANNLANASTTAFKRDVAVFRPALPFDPADAAGETPPAGTEKLPGGVDIAETATDFSQGSIVATGGELDIALSGPGFLRVFDGAEALLTRDGRLSLDPAGRLVTQNGGRAIRTVRPIPPDANGVEIDNAGNVFAVLPNGERSLMGRLDLVDVDDPQALVKVGDGLFSHPPEVQVRPAGPRLSVKQRALESSGTLPIGEMLNLIDASRAFEANLNMIRLQEESLAQLLQGVVRR